MTSMMIQTLLKTSVSCWVMASVSVAERPSVSECSSRCPRHRRCPSLVRWQCYRWSSSRHYDHSHHRGRNQSRRQSVTCSHSPRLMSQNRSRLLILMLKWSTSVSKLESESAPEVELASALETAAVRMSSYALVVRWLSTLGRSTAKRTSRASNSILRVMSESISTSYSLSSSTLISLSIAGDIGFGVTSDLVRQVAVVEVAIADGISSPCIVVAGSRVLLAGVSQARGEQMSELHMSYSHRAHVELSHRND